MIVTKLPTQANDSAPLAQPSTALVGFTGIVSYRGKLYAYITDGRRHWQIICEAKHLQDFDVFQECVFDSNGIWIHHPSQHRITARGRTKAWNDAVQTALERGSVN